MNDIVYTPVVGMEIHVELKTASKMFCGCKNNPFDAEKPNIYTCPVCLGLPGALPVPNKKAVEWTIMLGQALGCDISLFSKFDRKNYFYPDLAKGYQISQYDEPLCTGGMVKTELGDVHITRVHLEEDTGKLVHTTLDGNSVSLVDFNRSGVPLVEIVTEPEITSGEHARLFLKKLHQIVRYLGISDADMEKGSMRLEPNISVRKESRIENRESKIDTHELPPYKVEVKNINSFAFVKKAIEFEVARHIEILKTGAIPDQETRGWDEKKNVTVTQRKKEEAHDYRYFPEPDIPPMRFSKTYLDSLKKQLPELPDQLVKRLMTSYELSEYDATILSETAEKSRWFEDCVGLTKSEKALLPVSAKKIANWIINKKEWEGKSAQALVSAIASSAVVEVNPNVLQDAIQKVISANAQSVADIKNGKVQAVGPLIGQTIKELGVKADPNTIRTKILEMIK
jgi:aspartyl-tRNA(Asn)/glutamyl-tRNA(Gln) amidotransferase subunit B